MKNLTIDIQGQIALVQINRPKALNALNSETLDELYACLKEMELRRDIRILILTGAGTKAFVAGADISEMHQATAVEGLAMARLADRTFSLLENMPQVSIAAVNGYALGGGCEIAMACDIRVAAQNLDSQSAGLALFRALGEHSGCPDWWAKDGRRS